MTDRRALLLFAALAILTAFYPAFFGELPVPAGGSRQLLPDGSPPPDRNDVNGSAAWGSRWRRRFSASA
ncbi:MAG: hypothetical protein WEB59_15115 [Thermoanaerobaculia bacterium]